MRTYADHELTDRCRCGRLFSVIREPESDPCLAFAAGKTFTIPPIGPLMIRLECAARHDSEADYGEISVDHGRRFHVVG